jgi:hypothetical protein
MVLVILASLQDGDMSVVTPRPPRSDDRTSAEALEALIEEARRRARRRRLGYAAAALVAASALLVYIGFNGSRDNAVQQPAAEGLPGFSSQNEAGKWTLASGLEGGYISVLAVAPERHATVFAATLEAGVFKSLDGGRSWRRLNTPPAATRVDSLATDPRDPDTVYAGTGGGVFKSIDGGASWRQANVGLFGDRAEAGARATAPP